MKKKFLTLEDILKNPIRELKIPGLGIVKIKDPTVQDRIEASKEAQKLPNWNSMSDTEKGIEIQKLVALKMLVEPKISFEDYYKANDLTIITILDSVAMDYGTRLKALTDKRKRVVDNFLQEMKKEN